MSSADGAASQVTRDGGKCSAGLPLTDEGNALSEVRDTVLQLLSATPSAPVNLRVSTGQICVELTWAPVPVADPARSQADRPRDSQADAGAEPPDGLLVCSPAVGIFYQAPTPGAPPFVALGDTVTPGQQVGIVEMMKMMIPVEAEVRGTVMEMLVADAAPVEFGEPLISLAPTAG